MDNTFYITTPIYYVNDVPHIGHAYTTVAADVLARFARLRGQHVFFLTGLDEHGQKVQQAAQKAGIDPQLYCDRLAPQFENLWKRLNISNDDFVRTTQPRHKIVVQKTLQSLYDKGEIYQSDYTGWYCTADERFWTEKDVQDGLCPDCKRPVERLSEKNYFFRMSAYQDWLVRYIADHPDFIKPPSRRNEVLGFLKQPLEDLSISRPKSRLSWGIELPFDRSYVTYVWFDALVNYISIPGYLTNESQFQTWWPANFHLIGKDILTTHSVYWPTMLRSLGLEPPKAIFAHGWWTVEGEKMSKSRGNVVDPNAMIDRFGVDAFRYFLLREVPFGQDGDFSKNAMVARINSDLANGLGNLLSRTLTMIDRYCDGVIPTSGQSVDQAQETLIRQHTEKLFADVGNALAIPEFHHSLQFCSWLMTLCDHYIETSTPWALAKQPNGKDKIATVLYHCSEALRHLSYVLYAFMPDTAVEMARQLGLSWDFSKPVELKWNDGTFPGTRIAKGRSLFPRIEGSTRSSTAAQTTIAPKLNKGEPRVTDQPMPIPHSSSTTVPPTPAVQQPNPTPPTVAPITIDDFMKIQLKTATVLTAERVPNSEKLIKLQVDLGTEKRQIVAGIGKKYDPDALLGKRIVIVANLQPRKLMGLESQGMVLAAGEANVEGLITVLEDVAPGIKVK
ncbi:MAG TPA: methionine--tRNA ligase [Nitrospiraceae bacterium]|nr:methionine--tRNA ligase [Nitrospiraceae bacterium]